MKVSPLDPKIEGPVTIEIPPFRDERGFFAESFNSTKFREAGLPTEFIQDNHSWSKAGVLRGLHFQYDPPQGKLVWVAAGKIFDVMVDCRPSSPTYLQSTHIILDSKVLGQMIWIPPGFAHGFCVLENEPAHVIYKMNAPYNPQGETGLLWSDPELKINWPVENPTVSTRDQKLLNVKEFRAKFSR